MRRAIASRQRLSALRNFNPANAAGDQLPLGPDAERVLPQAADVTSSGRHDRVVPILLQKPLMAYANGGSLALTRFAVEASHDGAAQS